MEYCIINFPFFSFSNLHLSIHRISFQFIEYVEDIIFVRRIIGDSIYNWATCSLLVVILDEFGASEISVTPTEVCTAAVSALCKGILSLTNSQAVSEIRNNNMITLIFRFLVIYIRWYMYIISHILGSSLSSFFK